MLEDLLNKVWDLGWQAHKSSHVNGNRIDPIEFRKKATDEAKAEVIKAMPDKKTKKLIEIGTPKSGHYVSGKRDGFNQAIDDFKAKLGLEKQ